jgi:pimeloyl-ACP methyl ester carboxylesterase
MPGFGASEAPHWRYTFGELANWLQAFQKATDTMPAAIVGNSLGGRIAIESGLADPRTVTGLALLCPSPAFRRMRQFVPLVRLLSPDLSQLPMRFSHRFVRESIRFMFGEPDRLRPEWYDAAADEFRRIMRSPGHRRAFFASMREIYLEEAYGVNGFWDRLPRMTRPALFIWGGRDRLVPVGFERHVVCALPEARSVVLPACGHVPQYELPEQTLRLVRRFVDGLR